MLKNIPFSLIAFLAFLIRLTIVGASIGDAVALVGLASLYGFNLYLEHKKESSVSADFRKEIDELRGAINTVKLGNSLRK